jgi:hypothetical protein
MAKNEGISLLLDSESIDRTTPQLSKRANSLLKYHSTKLLKFFRTSEPIENEQLQEIPQIQIIRKNGSIYSIELTGKDWKSSYGFAYRQETISEIGQVVYNKHNLTSHEMRTLELVFIQAVLNPDNGRNMLVTENSFLLQNRDWFESHFPGKRLNIMKMEEAAEIVDLLFKYNSEYHISSHCSVSKHYWYWLAFRSKIPTYHVDFRPVVSGTTLGDMFKEKSILEAFAERFTFLLMSIDEMGFQYYLGVNNDTMESTTYHFNYFISLMTGIFDSLAIHTKNKYQLKFEGSHIPNKTSLQSNNGREFLGALKLTNAELRQHIKDNSDLINMPYLLRDRIIHREGSRATSMVGGGWQANLLFIQKDFEECLKRCGDSQEGYEPWTKFGVYSGSFLNPYKFSKTATILLSQFCNTYLQLMGYDSFIEEMRKLTPKDEFMKTLNIFEEDNLGL